MDDFWINLVRFGSPAFAVGIAVGARWSDTILGRKNR